MPDTTKEACLLHGGNALFSKEPEPTVYSDWAQESVGDVAVLKWGDMREPGRQGVLLRAVCL